MRARRTGVGDHSRYGYVTVSDAAALYDEYRAAGTEFIRPLANKPRACAS